MPEISPSDWLQYGALGLLGLGMFFASFIVYKVISKLMEARGLEQMALIEALQNNSAALAGLQATIQSMSQVMINCQQNKGLVSNVSIQEQERKKEDEENTE